MSNPVQVQSIAQISVRANDLPASVAFYRDVLGLSVWFEAPHMAILACGGIRLLLGPASEERYDHPSSIVYFSVPDIEAAYRALQANDAELLQKPHVVAKMSGIEHWMLFFRDPDGNVMALTSEVAVSE